MVLALSSLIGVLAGIGLWTMLRPLLGHPTFVRDNYRGRAVPTAGGLVMVAAVVAGLLVLSGLVRAGLAMPAGWRDLRNAGMAATVGFGMLGLLDDLVGDSSTTGYRGHLRALLDGQVTTGLLKVLGGGVVALAAVVVAVDEGLPQMLCDAALVALSANLANLLDRRPGRVIKAAVVVSAVMALGSLGAPELFGTAVLAGAAAALLVPDLRERLMIGDTGANPLGAGIALGAVVVFSPPVRLVALGVVLALNLVSERVSFSSVIAGNRVLRALDDLGRHPERGPR